MNNFHCTRCGGTRDIGDNFCRRCGHQFTVNLPAVQSARLPAKPPRQRTLPAPLVGSVALLAVGTGLEWLARRLAKDAVRTAGRALVSGGARDLRSRGEAGAAAVDEVLYVRRIQLRR